MNHYCTYFDSGFLPQGLALARSLARFEPDSMLWVLALDEPAAAVLTALRIPGVRVVQLEELERGDAGLLSLKGRRTGADYIFTLSPCWPRYLLAREPEIERVTYVDADMMFFSAPAPIFEEMAEGSIFLSAHRFPHFLAHYERHGLYNVGVLSWRRDTEGTACLDWWRDQCLAWCHDKLEGGRYADQKYLEEWPKRFGGVVECRNPGINLAPWNWLGHECALTDEGLRVDGRSLVVFHFARFRAIAGDWLWQSGQLDYGVMPWRLRQYLYGSYWNALKESRAEIAQVDPDWVPRAGTVRIDRAFARSLPLRAAFGSDWLRVGNNFISGRAGLGRYSGRVIAALRTIFLRKNRITDPASQGQQRQAGK